MKIEIEIPEDIYDGIKNHNLKNLTFNILLNAVLRGKVRSQGSGRTKKEPLTDKEQRIFLAAMFREEQVCKKVDDSITCREPYEDTLVSVCKSIERKVKKALWK